MVLPQFAAGPVLDECEMSGILFVLMQIILNAARFPARNWHQLFKLGSDQINTIGFGRNIRHDCQICHLPCVLNQLRCWDID